MKRVLLLGPTGMLGSAVYGVLHKKYQLLLALRNPQKLDLLERVYGEIDAHSTIHLDASDLYREYAERKGCPGPTLSAFLDEVGEVDYVINAFGVTIPFALRDPALTFFVNGALPHILAQNFGEKLIHITTDCVYGGTVGFPYNENSSISPPDLYGLSKSLGEPSQCLTIRTSIIGRELDGFTGLLEWFLKQGGKTITGFTGHFWNGITTQQFGEICDMLMSSSNSFPKRGLFHVFSTVVSKFEMLQAFQRKYGVRCTITPDNEKKLNRSLITVKELNGMLRIPSFDDMLAALKP
ncbi:MAG: sugar nucleotide-binding protein [Nitrososphaerales archaeon]